MFCRNGCYATVRNLRFRSIPEMNDCVVFTPDNPNLYSLNQAARLVLAFCDGRTGRALETAYCAALDPLLPRRTGSDPATRAATVDAEAVFSQC